PVDVQGDALAVERDHEPEADDDLRRGHRHHGQGEDLAAAVAEVAGEADQGEVPAVEHDLEREQDDQWVTPEQHAERTRREEEPGNAQIPGDLRSEQCNHRDGTSSTLRRECGPRMTPPIAATSRTIEVISNASRWSVRKSRPMYAGVPNVPSTCLECASSPPAFNPITTTISTNSAPAASTAPTACQLGPPAHGDSLRGPM